MPYALLNSSEIAAETGW